MPQWELKMCTFFQPCSIVIFCSNILHLQANGNLKTNVRCGQKVQWSCLVQGKDDQHKKPLWFGFKSIKCLAHLHCQNGSCSMFLWLGACNEVDWSSNLSQVFIVGQIISNPLVYNITIRFVVFTPSMYECACVVCITWFNLLDNLSKVAIHFGTHAHLVLENKCKKFIDQMIMRKEPHIFYWFLQLNFSRKQHL